MGTSRARAMFGGTAKQAHKATLIAKIDLLATDMAKMARTHTEVRPLAQTQGHILFSPIALCLV